MSKRARASIRRERTPFEWGLLCVSLAAIIAMAGGLIAYSLSFDSGRPDLRVSVRSVSDEPHTFVLTVDNEGGTTAIDVIVEVRRGTATDEVEFRAVPKGDFEEATVTMGGTGAPTARVASYKEP